MNLLLAVMLIFSGVFSYEYLREKSREVNGYYNIDDKDGRRWINIKEKAKTLNELIVKNELLRKELDKITKKLINLSSTNGQMGNNVRRSMRPVRKHDFNKVETFPIHTGRLLKGTSTVLVERWKVSGGDNWKLVERLKKRYVDRNFRKMLTEAENELVKVKVELDVLAERLNMETSNLIDETNHKINFSQSNLKTLGGTGKENENFNAYGETPMSSTLTDYFQSDFELYSTEILWESNTKKTQRVLQNEKKEKQKTKKVELEAILLKQKIEKEKEIHDILMKERKIKDQEILNVMLEEQNKNKIKNLITDKFKTLMPKSHLHQITADAGHLTEGSTRKYRNEGN